MLCEPRPRPDDGARVGMRGSAVGRTQRSASNPVSSGPIARSHRFCTTDTGRLPSPRGRGDRSRSLRPPLADRSGHSQPTRAHEHERSGRGEHGEVLNITECHSGQRREHSAAYPGIAGRPTVRELREDDHADRPSGDHHQRGAGGLGKVYAARSPWPWVRPSYSCCGWARGCGDRTFAARPGRHLRRGDIQRTRTPASRTGRALTRPEGGGVPLVPTVDVYTAR
jgi:hypothetical protein